MISADYQTQIAKTNIKFREENLKLLLDEDYKIHIVVKLDFVDDFSKVSEFGTISEISKDGNCSFSAEYKIVRIRFPTIELVVMNFTNIENILSKKNRITLNNLIEGKISRKSLVTHNSYQLARKSINYREINKTDYEIYRIFLFLFLPNELPVGEIKKSGLINVVIPWQRLITEVHPDNFYSQYLNLNNHFANIKSSKNERNEIIRLGLMHKFHKVFSKVNYGIILSIYNLSLQILSLLRNTIIDISVQPEEIGNYSINQIIIIEVDKKVGKISNEDQKIEKIGYIFDEIIHIDYERREGHIRKIIKVDQDEKDFYFHFDDCDFSPHLGDIVSFLPAINVFPSSFGLPKAYRITKIKDASICIISKINYSGVTLDFYGTAIDKENNEELSFIIRNASRILALNPKINDEFTFRIIGHTIEANKPFIKLLEKVKVSLFE